MHEEHILHLISGFYLSIWRKIHTIDKYKLIFNDNMQMDRIPSVRWECVREKKNEEYQEVN